MALRQMHHITAITGDLARNVAFYPRVLGLRLVKRTVIQEEPSTYHLFYGDRTGSPGTELSFFDWPQFKPHRSGARSVNRTLLRVPSSDAIGWWSDRLNAHGIETERSGEGLAFTAPDGLSLGLVVAETHTPFAHWSDGPIPEAYAIRGIQGAVLGVADVGQTADFLTETFGYSMVKEETDRIELALPGVTPDHTLTLTHAARNGFRGVGSVHHIALQIGADDRIEDWRERLTGAGQDVTEVVRRYYFDSIYTRIPGGILFELATEGRGLLADEDEATAGQRLTLPPFLEPQRAEIEAELPPFPEISEPIT